VLPWYCSSLLFVAIAAAVTVTRSLKVKLALAIGACLFAAGAVETWTMPHYLASGAALVFAAAMYGVRLLRLASRQAGALLVLLFTATIFVGGTQKAAAEFRRFETAATTPNRKTVAESLRAHGGRHLAIVRYGPGHDVNEDWVFNAADIDASPIVWARDMGPEKNRELMDYYRGRSVWLIYADEKPVKIERLPASEAEKRRLP